MICKKCNKLIPDASDKCPYCGFSTVKKLSKNNIFYVVLAIALVVVVATGVYLEKKPFQRPSTEISHTSIGNNGTEPDSGTEDISSEKNTIEKITEEDMTYLRSVLGASVYFEFESPNSLSNNDAGAIIVNMIDIGYVCYNVEDYVPYTVNDESNYVVNSEDFKDATRIITGQELSNDDIIGINEMYGPANGTQDQVILYHHNGRGGYYEIVLNQINIVGDHCLITYSKYEYGDPMSYGNGTPTNMVDYNAEFVSSGSTKYPFTIVSNRLGSDVSNYDSIMNSSEPYNKDYSYSSAYADLLDKNANQVYSMGRFFLGYIDEDDIPELIVPTGDFHAAGVDIYTYVDGEVISLGSYGSFGMISFGEKTGTIQSNYTGMGGNTFDFYQLSRGEIKHIINISSFTDFSDEQEHTTYRIDDLEVSQNAFQQKLSEMQGNAIFLDVGFPNGWDILSNINELRTDPSRFIVTKDNTHMWNG